MELGFNQIKSISPTIGELMNLEILSLFDNQISVLPETISKLATLKKLNLSYNRMAQFDLDIQAMSNLSELHIFKNNDITIKSLDIITLCQRETVNSLKYNLLIDETQESQFAMYKDLFESNKIGVINLQTKRMPEEHYKQIPYELSDKYGLIDPRLERLRKHIKKYIFRMLAFYP